MDLRIDELAQATGVSSRNIRAYQQRGLLPPPRLQGRTGFYGEEHLRRLELIAELQQRGFSLEAIRQTLDAWSRGGAIGDLLGFHQIITQPWIEEQSVELTPLELASLFPQAVEQPHLIAEAVERGLLVQVGPDRFRAPEILMRAGSELAKAGIPLSEIFELVDGVRRSSAEIAKRFVEIVSRRLIEPISEGTADPEEIRRVAESALSLRAVAVEVVRPFLAQELVLATEQALQEFRERTESKLTVEDAS